MTPSERFAAWREELAAERDELEAQLAEARSALATAEKEHREAVARRKELDDFVASAFEHRALAQPLWCRYRDTRGDLTSGSEKARGEAIAKVKALEERLASVSEAIGQIDQALTASKVTQFPRPAEEPPRRRTSPVEYDTIVGAA